MHIGRHRLHWGLIAAFSLLSLSSTVAGETSDVEKRADEMLSAIGGRSVWADLKNTINDSQQNRLNEPTVVRAVITMDFERPRFRIEMTGPNLHLIRVVDGDEHWRLDREGRIEPLPEELLARDLRWYDGHVYRTLHRLAKRDPALTLTAGTDDRIEVNEKGDRIAWFALDSRGEPYAFGAHDDEVGTICGPWKFEKDGVRHPIWVSRPDGMWRVNVEALEVNVALDDATFAQPATE